jgi:hypothetical protein
MIVELMNKNWIYARDTTIPTKYFKNTSKKLRR